MNGVTVDNPHNFNNDNYVNLGSGEDTLHGGNDADTLHGGHGEDILSGGHGSDLFIIELGDRYSTGETDFMTAICPGEDDRLTILTELVEPVVTNEWRGLAHLSELNETTDVSSLIDLSTNKFYSDVELAMEVELSNEQYYPRRFEYTIENNQRGIFGNLPPPMGGWKTGVNYISFMIPDDWYHTPADTPWASMTRLELYANEPHLDVPNETITFRNIRFGRTSGNCGIDNVATPKGLSSSDTLIDVFNAGKIALNASGGEMIAVVDIIEKRACERLTAEYNQELQQRIAETTARIETLEAVAEELRSVVLAELEDMQSSPPECVHS